MEINLKKIRVINVALSICVALVMSGIVMDFQFMGDRRDLSHLRGDGKNSEAGTAATSASDFTENKVIMQSGLMAPGGRLIYLRDKPKKKVSKAPPMSGKTIKAPNTKLSLKGTIVSSIGKSLAIFEDKSSKRQDIVSIGGDVFGAGKITVIDEDRVLLTAAGGVTHEYTMDFDSKNGSQFSTASNARRSRPGFGKGVVARAKWADELKMMQDMQRTSGPAAVGHYGGYVDVPSEDFDVEIKEELEEDIEDELLGEALLLPGASESFSAPPLEDGAREATVLSSLSAAVPTSRDVEWWDVYDALGSGTGNALTFVSYDLYNSGEPVAGFMVNGLGDGFFAGVFDLASGDVIIEVNEIPLNTAGAWQSISDGLWNSPNIRLSVLRDGVEKHFDFAVR